MWQTLIAVLGTLAGVGITSAYQARTARTARADARRAEGLTAITALVEALSDHRRTMWLREDLRLSGEDWAAARTESHATRSAITAPLLRVQLLLPDVADAAREAAAATYALRDAQNRDMLRYHREAAILTTDALVAAAGRQISI
ncbi:protein kilB [Streptomyces sp. NPDC001890]|uniref:protein kilB n=1 Tax=Streptomyces sp. NPDC001890 TaxID=3364620 RepID=UPI0036854B1B